MAWSSAKPSWAATTVFAQYSVRMQQSRLCQTIDLGEGIIIQDTVQTGNRSIDVRLIDRSPALNNYVKVR